MMTLKCGTIHVDKCTTVPRVLTTRCEYDMMKMLDVLTPTHFLPEVHSAELIGTNAILQKCSFFSTILRRLTPWLTKFTASVVLLSMCACTFMSLHHVCPFKFILKKWWQEYKEERGIKRGCEQATKYSPFSQSAKRSNNLFPLCKIIARKEGRCLVI